MGDYPNNFAYENGPSKGELILIGTRRISGKGGTLLIHIPKQDKEAYGLQQGELVKVTLERIGKIMPKQNRTGNPVLHKKTD